MRLGRSREEHRHISRSHKSISYSFPYCSMIATFPTVLGDTGISTTGKDRDRKIVDLVRICVAKVRIIESTMRRIA